MVQRSYRYRWPRRFGRRRRDKEQRYAQTNSHPRACPRQTGVLDRIGHYAERQQFLRVRLFFSEDLNSELTSRLIQSLRSRSIQIVQLTPVSSIAFENVAEIFRRAEGEADAIIGFGGGKALDVAKYLAFLFRLPYF